LINRGTLQHGSISDQIWRLKYRQRAENGALDQSLSATWLRVAEGIAEAERPEDPKRISKAFFEAMSTMKLIPAGRIIAGAGTGRDVTLSNTFVMRGIPNNLAGIMDVVKEAALTMQMGGGIGFDFSTLSPQSQALEGQERRSAGPLAAMEICDAVCAYSVSSVGRGAMMATLRCDHPDIEMFILAKSEPSRFRNFNISIMITDDFMEALLADASWALRWEEKVVRHVPARKIWNMIMQQTYQAAEPGVLFIDRINSSNPLRYLEVVSATNSCAEQPLPPNGTCPLASINLAQLVQKPFSRDARLNLAELERLVGLAVRLLDNTIDVSLFPLLSQKLEARNKRRIGVGVTGLADALAMTGVTYGSPKAVHMLGKWLRLIRDAAYRTSALLASERGVFPLYDPHRHLSEAFLGTLAPDIRELVEACGLRNGTLTTIAPVGTTSLLAGNVSSGIEPIFATSFHRSITEKDGTKSKAVVIDFAARKFREKFGDDAPLPNCFKTSSELEPEDHLTMQSEAQRWIDSGISKTVNCPETIPFDAFEGIYLGAYDSGCKGCTTFRPNLVTGSILTE